MFHLRYSLPASSGDGPSAAGSGPVAEIVCTGEHPFYVGNRAQPDFVPARELQPGDSLTFSSGGQGQVLSLASERAPPGETFTTYNFEVADFHTYFAGEGGVWVHNFSRSLCETLQAACWHSQKWLQITDPVGNKFRILENSFDHLKVTGGKFLESLSGNRSLLVTGLEELRDYTQHGDFRKIASFAEQKSLKSRFFGSKVPHDFEVHHLVEERISKALGVDAGNTALLESSPAINLPRNEKLWAGKTADIDVFDGPIVYHQGPNGIARAIGEIFERNGFLPKTVLNPGQQQILLTELRDLYVKDPRFKHLNAWSASRDWLRNKFPHIPIPN